VLRLAVLLAAWAIGVHAEPATDVGGRTLRVGPQHAFARIGDAARVAKPGDTIVIEPGTYTRDVASWPQDNITIRAARCCARLVAGGRSAQGKAIFVIAGANVVIENLEFSGARVPHRNGAGIRHEGPGKLVIRNCRFTANEMGLLTSNNNAAEIVVEASEFDHNGVAGEYRRGGRIGHQIYVGRVARFTLRDTYVHHGSHGHLVKSRARENVIETNRLTDEDGGQASYELEFPDGGIAYVIGNVIGQSGTTENSAMISFGAEHLYWPRNELHVVNNTLIDEFPGTRNPIQARHGADLTTLANNLLVGEQGEFWHYPGFTRLASAAVDMPGAARGDYRLNASSKLVGTASDVGAANGFALLPGREYVHPRASRPVRIAPLSPGAMQSPIY